MKVLFKRLILSVGLLSISAVPLSVCATNGYFLIGYGAKSRGMGGVGVAYGTDGLAAAANPATMADVDVDTMRVDAGVEYFRPKRAVVQDSAALESGFPGSDTGVDHRSGSNDFLIPSMGMIYKFNRKVTMGFAAIGNGANTRYNQSVPDNPTCVNGDQSGGTGSTLFNFNCNADSPTAGVQLLQMQMLPSVAYSINKNHTVGASAIIAVQQFRAYGLGAFQDLGFAGSNQYVSGEGNDYSYGAGLRLGWMGKFFKQRLTLGANYASRTYMTEFDSYKNLFAEQGDFDIPSHFALGMAFKVTPKLTVAADVQKILYSDIASINNWGPSVVDPGDLNINGSCKGQADDVDPDNCKLGGDDGMGFGWDDQTIYKIGINYDWNNEWSFRAGFNYGKAPMDDNEVSNDQVLFNMLAPAVTEKHATIGASYRPSRNIEWSFNYSHAFSNTVKGPSAFGPTGDEDIDKNIDSISLDMEINTVGVSFAYKM